ncbi:hypothetical protein H6G20_06145 [Desertifilum sp. FACHB-1129]|uniref:hypothetical protein n=1 Tax=unclassified Desertifilum TaxID=2621682 RepID=UPI0016865783|nr:MULTISPECIES: hypothetical protein [unclassified Desertifilum]MBD2311238.1 hypothetical protein [Desertifilum sp. FACHB-1129]MBD2324317.1 hypothetical protein [Desertifilum sp. FACHB-866]MBD2334331.1 hypothetical protein [Desertifilum sp. FACHB-868]MDA0213177.1 hypothetical protein [Cyanobacteria bacterium FC1]
MDKPIIHLINSQGGGKGKSLFTRVMAHYCTVEGYAVQLIDADAGKRNIKPFYPETLEIAMSAEEYWGADAILECLEQGLSPIVNLPAGANAPLTRWLEDDGVMELKLITSTVANQPFELELDEGEPLKIVQWFLCDATPDSLNDFKLSVADFDRNYPNRLIHVLVKNQGLSPKLAWNLLEDRQIEELLSRTDIKSVDFANFPMRERDRLQALQWTFAEASRKTSEYSITERQRIVTFLKKTIAQVKATQVWKNAPLWDSVSQSQSA